MSHQSCDENELLFDLFTLKLTEKGDSLFFFAVFIASRFSREKLNEPLLNFVHGVAFPPDIVYELADCSVRLFRPPTGTEFANVPSGLV